jgi:hypothetical protein
MELKMIDDIDLDYHHHMYANHDLFPLELQSVPMLGQLAISDRVDQVFLFLNLN